MKMSSVSDYNILLGHRRLITENQLAPLHFINYLLPYIKQGLGGGFIICIFLI